MQRIPTARPSWDDEMRNAAIETLDSRKWVKGDKGKQFGSAFAEYCGALSAAPCQNGSSSLWAALRLLGIGEGDEVIVPSFTFIASATAIPLVGATAVFVDIEREFWCLDYDTIEAAITSKTKAIIGVHIFGQPYDPRIIDLCKTKNISLIEDAAQAHGATQISTNGEKLVAGSMGDVGCFSFFPSKNMAVGGEGGMLTTTNPELTEKVKAITNHGRAPNLESMELGSNLRMSEVSAAIGLVQLSNLEKWVERRREIAQKYNDAFENHPLISVPKVRDGAEHAWHQYCVYTKQPDELMKHLDKNAIDSRSYYSIPCHHQAVFTKHRQFKTPMPVTDEVAGNLVAIPVMHELTDQEVERIISAVRSFNV
jgi:dTDP-4-amino-4,6-dideoxygalactose transaminase